MEANKEKRREAKNEEKNQHHPKSVESPPRNAFIIGASSSAPTDPRRGGVKEATDYTSPEVPADLSQSDVVAAFAALSSWAKQLWLFVEPCVCKPLMVNPLRHDGNPHLKGPAPQGWACTFYQHDAARLQKGEAGRPWRSRRSGLAELLSHESLRLRTVRMALDRLCDEVTVGSEMDFRQCPWTDSRLLLP